MTTRTATATLDGDGLRFVALTGTGHSVVMDNAEGDSGPRPAELLLVAQAGCTAMDVVSILRKKRQAITRYEVRVMGEQRDDPPPHVFEQIRVVHVVEGAVDVEALRRAIDLSATKYCTVTGNLASGVAEIHHAYVLRDAAGEEHYGEVAVTGPAESPDSRGRPVASSPAGKESHGWQRSTASCRTARPYRDVRPSAGPSPGAQTSATPPDRAGQTPRGGVR